MIDGFMDYSSETIDILKESVEYLEEFVKMNSSNKDIDIRKYSDAIYNGNEIISHVVIH